MATQLQASIAHKAATTTSATTGASVTAGAKSSNGVHTHSSSAGVAAIAAAAASTASVKTSSSASATVLNSSSTSLSSSIGIKHASSYDSLSVTLTEEQRRILHQGTCSLGDALSQVPWMKFRLVAEPNMDIFASDIRLRTFIREVTELSVSIVTKQCQEEIAVLVAALITSLSSSMEVRIKLIVETIIEQIAALCLQDTMTGCHNLHEIKEKVCFPRHCEPHRSDCHSDYDHHKHPHDTYGDSDKHRHPHDSYGDSDKHKRSHDGYGDSDKHHKHPHDTYSDKHGEGKHETPTKKYTGKSTPTPGTKTAS